MRAAGPPAARFMIAHEYCHLIADVDPYANRFCSHGGPAGADSRAHAGGRVLTDALTDFVDLDDLELAELRADLFARAFLLPEAHFRRALRAFDIRPGPTLNLERIGDLAYYYGVETPVVLNRLADLGLLSARDAQALIATHVTLPAAENAARATTVVADDAPADAPVDAPRPALLPGVPPRFAALGLALFLRGEISLDQMATLLNVDLRAAIGLLSATMAPPAGQAASPAGDAESDLL